jgi:hypothetical protein
VANVGPPPIEKPIWACVSVAEKASATATTANADLTNLVIVSPVNLAE